MAKKNKSQANNNPTVISPIRQVRSIKTPNKIQLYVLACGRCQFRGCNRDLMKHEITQTDGNYGEMSHIVAFEENGPRGKDGLRPKDINAVENLMLLCAICHKRIDSNPIEYPCELLKIFKQEHEERIRIGAELCPSNKSAILIFKAPIRGHDVSIDDNHVRQAMLPHYPVSTIGSRIDLTNLKEEKESLDFLNISKSQIKRVVSSLCDINGELEKANHLSVFGLGPIVHLMYLGSSLSNKIPTSFYQKHRDTEDWKWKKEGQIVNYKVSKLMHGAANAPIALILSLSGKILIDNLPDEYKSNASVYEITLECQNPSPMFLRQKKDLEAFRTIYIETLGLIAKEHGIIEFISVFPAIPAPIAILCGRERLPKVHPKLKVYDFDHDHKGFKFQSVIGE